MLTSGEGAGSTKLDEIVDVTVLGDNTVEPECVSLQVGSRIRWTNKTSQTYVIYFHRGSPFQDNSQTYNLSENGTVISAPISEKVKKGELKYEVSSAGERELESLQTPPQDPTIIIRDPH